MVTQSTWHKGEYGDNLCGMKGDMMTQSKWHEGEYGDTIYVT
jgi:hypothetical protein